jgi:hypothetical protein
MIDSKRQITASTMIDYYLDVFDNSVKQRHKEYAIAMIAYHSGITKYPHRDIVETLN